MESGLPTLSAVAAVVFEDVGGVVDVVFTRIHRILPQLAGGFIRPEAEVVVFLFVVEARAIRRGCVSQKRKLPLLPAAQAISKGNLNLVLVCIRK
jgi:hypothetical protein